MHPNPYLDELIQKEGVPKPDIEVPLCEQYGQLAEDVIVDSLLSAWAVRADADLKSLKYLEIGGNHPFATSATFLLNRRYGMTGVIVEANDELIETLRNARPNDTVVHCAVTPDNVETIDFFVSNQSELSSLHRRFVEEWRGGEVGIADVRTVPAMRVDRLIEQNFEDEPPVFLAIDIEGMDLQVLQDLDWSRCRPVVVQVEPSDHFVAGNSDAIIKFMTDQGYILSARTDINLIFQDNFAIIAPKKERKMKPATGPTSRYDNNCSVGIVTRTKDRAVLLRRALESVSNQTYPHWQLVVVNDGGAPEPVNELVSSIFGEDSRVKVLHHETSKGMEAASNAGLVQLSTDLAVIHDDDDSWAPDMLAVTTGILRQQNTVMPTIRGIATRINWVRETVVGNNVRIEDIKPWQRGDKDELQEGLIDLSRMLVKNQFPPIGFVFDLEVCRELGMFDETLPVLGDWDFHQRFCMAYDVWVHPEALAFYHHRQNATGALGNTVIAGRSKHLMYNTLLRNRWLRAATQGQGVNSQLSVLLREQGLEFDKMEMRPAYAPDSNPPNRTPGVTKKKKTGLAKVLSDLNYRRKALRYKQ